MAYLAPSISYLRTASKYIHDDWWKWGLELLWVPVLSPSSRYAAEYTSKGKRAEGSTIGGYVNLGNMQTSGVLVGIAYI